MDELPVIETVQCDQGCGTQLFKFANVSTCPDCRVTMERAALSDADKAAQWDAAMVWLDRAQVRYPLRPGETLQQRLVDLWRQVNE